MEKVKRVNMLDTANEFLEKNKRGFRLDGKPINKSRIKDAFECITKYEKEEKKFLKQSKPNKYNTGINNKYIDKVVDSVQIREDLIERLKAVSSKNINHYIYCQYIKFLNKDKGMSIEKLPRYYTELERRLEIIKRIHKGCNASDISDMAYDLLLDESNIHRDLRIISDGEMSVMGQRVKVEYRKQNDENGEEYILSTAHPLFLVQNLEQIIALLNGLKYSYEIYGYKEYARETAVSIWMQLSDYATNRILNELPKEELKIDIDWYKMIADEAEERKRKLEEEDYIIDSFKTLINSLFLFSSFFKSSKVPKLIFIFPFILLIDFCKSSILSFLTFISLLIRVISFFISELFLKSSNSSCFKLSISFSILVIFNILSLNSFSKDTMVFLVFSCSFTFFSI